MFFSSIEEINGLLSKGMSNIYYWEKLAFSNLVGKKNCQRVNLKKCTSFEEQKVTRFIWGKVYFRIVVFSCLSSTKPCLRFLLICFLPEVKGFYQSSLDNEVKTWNAFLTLTVNYGEIARKTNYVIQSNSKLAI